MNPVRNQDNFAGDVTAEAFTGVQLLNPLQNPFSVPKAQLAGYNDAITRQRNYGYASSRYRHFAPQPELLDSKVGFEMSSLTDFSESGGF